MQGFEAQFLQPVCDAKLNNTQLVGGGGNRWEKEAIATTPKHPFSRVRIQNKNTHRSPGNVWSPKRDRMRLAHWKTGQNWPVGQVYGRQNKNAQTMMIHKTIQIRVYSGTGVYLSKENGTPPPPPAPTHRQGIFVGGFRRWCLLWRWFLMKIRQ